MGADRTAVYVYQYGPPPAMAALLAAAKVQREDDLWRTYMAEISWIPAALMVNERKPERFPDLLNALRGNQPAKDERSAKEIIDGILNKLRADVEEKKVKHDTV